MQSIQRLFTCSCEPVFITLLRFGLWAATPQKPQIVFTLAFMKLARAVVLESQASLSGFCMALQKANSFYLNVSYMYFKVILQYSMFFALQDWKCILPFGVGESCIFQLDDGSSGEH